MKEIAIQFNLEESSNVLLERRGDTVTVTCATGSTIDSVYSLLRTHFVNREVGSTLAETIKEPVSGARVLVDGVPAPVDVEALKSTNIKETDISHVANLVRRAEELAAQAGMTTHTEVADLKHIDSEDGGVESSIDSLLANKEYNPKRFEWKAGDVYSGQKVVSVKSAQSNAAQHLNEVMWELTLANGDCVLTDDNGKELEYTIAEVTSMQAPPDTAPTTTILPSWTAAEKIAEKKSKEDLFYEHTPPSDVVANHRANKVIRWCYDVAPELVDRDREMFVEWCVTNPKQLKAFSIMSEDEIRRKVSGILSVYGGV